MTHDEYEPSSDIPYAFSIFDTSSQSVWYIFIYILTGILAVIFLLGLIADHLCFRKAMKCHKATSHGNNKQLVPEVELNNEQIFSEVGVSSEQLFTEVEMDILGFSPTLR